MKEAHLLIKTTSPQPGPPHERGTRSATKPDKAGRPKFFLGSSCVEFVSSDASIIYSTARHDNGRSWDTSRLCQFSAQACRISCWPLSLMSRRQADQRFPVLFGSFGHDFRWQSRCRCHFVPAGNRFQVIAHKLFVERGRISARSILVGGPKA